MGMIDNHIEISEIDLKDSIERLLLRLLFDILVLDFEQVQPAHHGGGD
jgi:hypothetical protein